MIGFGRFTHAGGFGRPCMVHVVVVMSSALQLAGSGTCWDRRSGCRQVAQGGFDRAWCGQCGGKCFMLQQFHKGHRSSSHTHHDVPCCVASVTCMQWGAGLRVHDMASVMAPRMPAATAAGKMLAPRVRGSAWCGEGRDVGCCCGCILAGEVQVSDGVPRCCRVGRERERPPCPPLHAGLFSTPPHAVDRSRGQGGTQRERERSLCSPALPLPPPLS